MRIQFVARVPLNPRTAFGGGEVETAMVNATLARLSSSDLRGADTQRKETSVNVAAVLKSSAAKRATGKT